MVDFFSIDSIQINSNQWSNLFFFSSLMINNQPNQEKKTSERHWILKISFIDQQQKQVLFIYSIIFWFAVMIFAYLGCCHSFHGCDDEKLSSSIFYGQKTRKTCHHGMFSEKMSVWFSKHFELLIFFSL